MIRKLTSDGLKGVARIRKVTSGGLRTVARRRKLTASGLETVYVTPVSTGMSLSSAPASLVLSEFENSTISGGVTVTPSGGLAPYTYAASVLTFSAAATPTIANGTTASPTFTQTGVLLSDTETATFRVTVTDALSSAASVDIPASFTNISFA